MPDEEYRPDEVEQHGTEQTVPDEEIADQPSIPEGMLLIPVELAIALEDYLGSRPVIEVIQGWTGLNSALNEAGIER